MTKISLLGELAKRSAAHPGEAREHLDKLSGLASETAETLGELIWTVKPANDSVRSLASHLCQQMEEYLRETDIRCRFDLQDDLAEAPVPSELRRQIVLAVKEAVNNLVKHSGATEARLAVRLEAGVLRVSVCDNGRGLPDVPAPRPGGGEGLGNLKQSMARFGGSSEVVNQPEGGVRVELRAPLAPAGGS